MAGPESDDRMNDEAAKRLSESQSDAKRTPAGSFFAKLAATAQLARQEAYRTKLESIDLRQAEGQIGKKAYEAGLVPADLSSLAGELDEIGAQPRGTPGGAGK